VEIHWSMLYFHVWMISTYLEAMATYLEECLLMCRVTTYFDAYLTFGVPFHIFGGDLHILMHVLPLRMSFHAIQGTFYIF
jgi:hypothetical protein